MDIDKLFVLGLAGLTVYMMIFQTDKWKAINEEGWKNMNKAGKAAETATKFGIGVFRLLRRR
ncbi:hypothetical protein J8F10_09275 [Gemmata sp. G18]|uniref:Uncharacterized protein n=1 Tax=Gemmata palustris TaxID=2822762 RepID=A0ABS5BP27_9BACT|nr:hypothetical protein [Gemmata palustris]MBP3955471.1 hypothetical protein [Gemmata palustris]